MSFACRLIATALGSMLFLPAANAQSPSLSDGNTFYSKCQIPGDANQFLACAGYFRGLHDGTVGGLMPYGCAPKNATYQQMQDLLIKYMRENPSIRHWSTAAIYQSALGDAFPCSGKR
jgi:hypothetical protein